MVGSATISANSASQPINFNSRDSGNVIRGSALSVNSSGNFAFNPYGGVILGSQWQSTASTGTPPLIVASTTPVANLNASPVTYNAVGTQQTNGHLIEDSCTLGTNCAVTLTGSAAYTSSTSYSCQCTDQTAAQACRANQTSGSAVTFTGTGTDVLRFVCAGN